MTLQGFQMGVGGWGHESIVPKEGSGKATSSAVAAGTMGGRKETAHTIEKELGGGREDVKDWETATEGQDED